MRYLSLYGVLMTAGLVTSLGRPQLAFAQEPVRLEERFASGDQYSVKTRTEVSGTLSPTRKRLRGNAVRP